MRKLVDSGIEWIGMVPEGWETIPLKYMCVMHSGKNLVSEDIAPEGDYPVYGGNGIRGYYSKANEEGPCLLVGRQGALCGNVHRIGETEKIWATEHAVVTTSNENACLWFLYYMLVGLNLNQFVSPTAAQPGLAVSSILNLKACLPPLPEQQRIVAFLDTKTALIDSLIDVEERKIEQLGAYKKSLVYEVVTGKWEVV